METLTAADFQHIGKCLRRPTADCNVGQYFFSMIQNRAYVLKLNIPLGSGIDGLRLRHKIKLSEYRFIAFLPELNLMLFDS